MVVGQVFGIDFGLVGCHEAKELNAVVFQHISEFVHHPDVFLGPFAGAVVGPVLVDRLDAVVVVEGFGVEQPTVLAGHDEVAGGLVEKAIVGLVVELDVPFSEAEVLAAVLLRLALVLARGEALERQLGFLGGKGDTRQGFQFERMPFFLHEDKHKPQHRQKA